MQEKNITYPTDAKLHKKIIKNVLKIVHDKCLPLRQSYTRTLKGIYRSQRFRNGIVSDFVNVEVKFLAHKVSF